MDKDFEIVSNIKITHPQKKILQAKKIDIVNYYNDVAKLMLPFLDKRLLSVIRLHDGEKFFKKHPMASEDVERFDTKKKKILTQNKISKSNASDDVYFFLKNKTQLLKQVQLGSIEFHTWGCKCDNFSKPDLMVFDLDPDQKLSLEKLRQGVLDLKEILDELKLKPYLKTSGGKGYHVYTFFDGFSSWKSYETFCKNVAVLMEQKYPDKYTTNIRKEARKGKIFIDFLRNKKGATCVAPYSLRARKNLPISMPIKWEQLFEVKPNDVTINNYKTFLKVFSERK